MRSIILRNVSQSHRIVIHQVETKFFKKMLGCQAFPIHIQSPFTYINPKKPVTLEG
jgi:hypothetical protein